jgi:hypothetical protein
MEKRAHDSYWLQVHEKLVTLARTRAGLESEEGEWLLRAFDSNLHVRFGYGSFVEYVERPFGFGPRVTMEKIRVAKILAELEETSEALKSGKISSSHARELARVATPETEKAWLSASADKTVRELERMVSGHVPGDLPDGPKDPAAERYVLRFEVTAETHATFHEALAKLTRDAGQHLDDDARLLLLSRMVLGGPTDEGRASYQVTMTVCDRCQAGEQTGKGEREPVDRTVVEMARCDAQVIPDTHPPSGITKRVVGNEGRGKRATQATPPAVRREVMHRDSGRCCVPGCRHAIFVHVHHIDLRSEDGDDDPDNLIVLCAAHHRALHRGTLRLEGRPSTALKFSHADGSTYDRPAAPIEADLGAKVFRALCHMGFRERDAKLGVERARAHVGVGATIDALLRRALGELAHAR